MPMSDPRFSFITSVSEIEEAQLKAQLGGTAIRVHVGVRELSTYPGQVLLIQLATLLARLFDRIELVGDDTVQTHPSVRLINGSVLEALRVLLPQLRPLSPEPSNGTEIVVVLGDSSSTDGSLYLGSDGWTALVSTRAAQRLTPSTNPIGPLAAGALGAAEVFKSVFAGRIPGAFSLPEYTLSLLTYRQAGPQIHLPEEISIEAVQFGAGSIGCGFMMGFMVWPHFAGHLSIVDNGKFDTKNPYKYQVLDWATASRGSLKASWMQQRLSSLAPSLSVRACVGTARSYAWAQPHDYKIPLAVSAVDTVEARLEIQDTLPRRVVNAGIEGTIAEVSSHGFGTGACLACLGIERQLESWDSKPIADRLGLAPERVHELILRNEGMTDADLERIRSRGVAPLEHLSRLSEYLGQPVLSLYQRVMYSEAPVGSPQGTRARITTAFCSAFAGVLLFAEFLKENVRDLVPFRVNNSFRMELLGVPGDGPFQHPRDARGWCLCHSSFRQALYRDRYSIEGA